MKIISLLKTIFLCIVLTIKFSCLQADQILLADDARVLCPLFKMLLGYSEAGYVLYDKKPICGLTYFQRPLFFREITFRDEVPISISCAKEILERPVLKSENILFHFDKTGGLFLIINRRLFLETVKENLPLFQYVLGPNITPESLLTTLLSPGKGFLETLNNDKVLIGIVLGFGTQNALFGSRSENLNYDLLCIPDLPPLSPNLNVCQDDDSKEALLFEGKGETKFSLKERDNYKPTIGFLTLLEESKALTEKELISTKQLSEENPRFVFGDYEHDPTFIQGLEDTQRKIQHLLQQPDWFEKTLEMVSGEKVSIQTFEITPLGLAASDLNFLFAKLLREELIQRGHDSAYFSSFTQGLLNPNDDHIPPCSLASAPRSLHHLKLARKNLEESDRFFATLDQDPDSIPVLKRYLYYKVLEEGRGAEKINETKVAVDLNISNSIGNVLNSAQYITLELNETIPGFAHGLKGMKKKEQRVIYIHPAVAYGVHTYLDKGVYFKALVTMNKIERCLWG